MNGQDPTRGIGRMFFGMFAPGPARAEPRWTSGINARGFATGTRAEVYGRVLRSIPAETWRGARRPNRKAIADKLDSCTPDDLRVESALATDRGRDAALRLRAKLQGLRFGPPDLVSMWQARLALAMEIARIRADRLTEAECAIRLVARPSPSRVTAWTRCPLTGSAIGVTR